MYIFLSKVIWKKIIIQWFFENFFTQLIYDKDILIGADDNDDGMIDEATEFKSRVQFKTVFGVGLTYIFGDKK